MNSTIPVMPAKSSEVQSQVISILEQLKSSLDSYQRTLYQLYAEGSGDSKNVRDKARATLAAYIGAEQALTREKRSLVTGSFERMVSEFQSQRVASENLMKIVGERHGPELFFA